MYSAINRAIQNAVVTTVESHATTKQCLAAYTQALTLRIDSSDFEVSGDFIVRQKAKYALVCAQRVPDRDALIATIQKRVTEAIGDVVRRDYAAAAIDNAEIEQFVGPALQSAVEDCVDRQLAPRNDGGVARRVVIAPEIDITGSKIRVGCSEQKIADSGQACVESLTAGRLNDPACQTLVECAEIEGDFSIEVAHSVSDECNALSKIALLVAAKVQESLVSNGAKKNEQSSSGSNIDDNQASSGSAVSVFPVWQIVLIALGSLLLLFIIAFTVYFIRQRSLQSKRTDYGEAYTQFG